MASCGFCSIADGSAPAIVVYQDAEVVGFMDKNPINPGHVLIIPKVHHEHLQHLPEACYRRVWTVAKRIAQALEAEYAPPKVGLVVAGLDVRHAHVHVVPLHEYHDITSRRYIEGGRFHRAGEGTHAKASFEALELEAARIRRFVSDRGRPRRTSH